MIALSLDLAACACTRFRFRTNEAQNEIGAHAYKHTCIEARLQRNRHSVLYRMCPACSCCPRAYTNARSDQLAKTHIAESMNTCIDIDAACDHSGSLSALPKCQSKRPLERSAHGHSVNRFSAPLGRTLPTKPTPKRCGKT